MHPAARIEAAIELLYEIEETARPADGVASAFFRGRRFIGSKDRRVIADMVWGVCRFQARLDWWLQHFDSRSITPRTRVIAYLCLVQGANRSRMQGIFTGKGYSPHVLSSAEDTLVEKLMGADVNPATLHRKHMPLHVKYEIPAWLVPRLEAQFGEHFETEAKAWLVQPDLHLRANTLKASREKALAALQAEKITCVPSPLSPWGMRVDSRHNLGATQALKDGLIEVQDEGSQLIAAMVQAQPGDAVVDFCAGAGGKTLAIAADMQNKGRLVACDVSEGRLKRSTVRLRRAGVHNVTPHTLSSEADKWVKRNKGRFDRVLLDVPCSGTGTWRRNPDARWRFNEETLQDLVQKQAAILESAQRLVKPGGRLVYATCAVLADENEHQVRRFLDKHPAFTLIAAEDVWAALQNGQATPAPYPGQGEMMRLSPARHGTDGYFVAVMQRADAPIEDENDAENIAEGAASA
jgi:16S rRNA (cytosine967-C5)-methyltransferase